MLVRWNGDLVERLVRQESLVKKFRPRKSSKNSVQQLRTIAGRSGSNQTLPIASEVELIHLPGLCAVKVIQNWSEIRGKVPLCSVSAAKLGINSRKSWSERSLCSESEVEMVRNSKKIGLGGPCVAKVK